MPRDARATREALLRAGARLFAAEGVDAARTRDIVALAGQANDSAITYHFGSRQGLLAAILRAGVDRMEPAREAALPGLDPADLRGVVAAVVGPIADELRSGEGRDFLCVVVQVAGRSGVRGGEPPPLIADTAIARQLGLLEEACRAHVPAARARERIAAFIAFLTAALADRARSAAPLSDHDDYVADLVEMLTAALRAPLAARLPG
ncbi:TetR/AcrR family transcriptional regulator [Spirillospora sp. NPDC127200]